MSIFMLAFRGGMPLGSLAIGFLATRICPTWALVAGSVVLGSTGIGFLMSNSGIKKL